MSEYARAQAGDAEALSSLVRRHMPLVQSLAGRFSFSEDAFQQGCVGLVKAIRRYRADSGCLFSTYAVPVILGEMRRARARTLGWRAQARLNRAKRYRDEVYRHTGKEPAVAAMARQAGVPPEEMALLLERENPIQEEIGAWSDRLPDPDGERWLLRLFIRDILGRMPRDEEWFLRQRFMHGRSQTDLAKRLRVTQSAASRKEKAARNHFRTAWLDEP